MSDKIRSPFSGPAPPGKKGYEGVYNHHKLGVVSKPADKGADDLPLKFYTEAPSLKAKPSNAVRSPMDDKHVQK